MSEKAHLRVVEGSVGLATGAPTRPPLIQGGGGSTFDPMEARVAKLESSVTHIERDMAEVRVDIKSMNAHVSELRERLARLEERVAHLPGKGFIVTCTTVTLGIMVALVTLAPKLQVWVGSAAQ